MKHGCNGCKLGAKCEAKDTKDRLEEINKVKRDNYEESSKRQ